MHNKELNDLSFIEKSLVKFLVNSSKTEQNSIHNSRNNSRENLKLKGIHHNVQTDYIPIVKKMKISNRIGKYGVKTSTPDSTVAAPKVVIAPSKIKVHSHKKSLSNSFKGSRETLKQFNSTVDLPVLNIIPQIIHANKYMSVSRECI